MADTGLKNKELLKELTISGSLAIKSKNEFGVNLFAQENLKDGVIYGSLVKPKYNETELVKSVDTIITELLPVELPELPDTVLRSVYNDVTQSVIDLTINVENLNIEISELNSKVLTLEAVTESLRVEIDSKDLLIEVANNQLEESNKKISDITIDLTNAIQRGIAESVERVSLFARNESLISTITSLEEQIKTLRDQLFGRQAAIQEGATTTSTFGVSVKPDKIGVPQVNALLYYARLNANNGAGWLNGPNILIENFTENPITIRISYPTAPLKDNIKVGDLLRTFPPIEIPASTTIEFGTTGWFKGGDTWKLNDLYATRDRVFKGNITFTLDGQPNNSLNFPIHFRKQSGKTYSGPI